MRALISILAALLIAVTSQAYALAKAAPDPAGRMVLCIGAAVMVVLTDSDGQPVEVPHTCPEATLIAAAGPALPAPTPPSRLVAAHLPEAAALAHVIAAPHPSARAPPAPV